MPYRAMLGSLFGFAVAFLAGCQTYDGSSGFDDYPRYVRTAVLPTLPENEDEPADLTDQSTLKDYLVYAALNSPQLEAAFHRWKATLEQIPQVKALPDPMVTYQYYLVRMEFAEAAPRQTATVEQMLPWFGKLELRGNAAAEAAEAQRQRFEMEKLRLFFTIKDAYYEYAYVSQAISTTEESARLLQHFEEVALVRYKAAAAGHPDVIRAQVEQAKLENELWTLRQLLPATAAKLNAALNRPPDAPLGAIAADTVLPAVPEDQQWLSWLRESSPRLAELDRMIAEQQAMIGLARKEYYPDVTLGVEYMDMELSGDRDPVAAMISLNLPIWREKLDAGLRQARRNYWAAVSDRRAAENTLTADLKMALYRLRDAQRKAGLYGDTLLPKARQSIEATQTAYQAGQGTFLDLIDAQRVLLEFELANQRAQADRAQRLAEVEMLVGRSASAAGNPAELTNVEIRE